MAAPTAAACAAFLMRAAAAFDHAFAAGQALCCDRRERRNFGKRLAACRSASEFHQKVSQRIFARHVVRRDNERVSEITGPKRQDSCPDRFERLQRAHMESVILVQLFRFRYAVRGATRTKRAGAAAKVSAGKPCRLAIGGCAMARGGVSVGIRPGLCYGASCAVMPAANHAAAATRTLQWLEIELT